MVLLPVIQASLIMNILGFIVSMAAGGFMIYFVVTLVPFVPKVLKGEENVGKLISKVGIVLLFLGIIFASLSFTTIGESMAGLWNNVSGKAVEEVNKGVNTGGTPGQSIFLFRNLF